MRSIFTKANREISSGCVRVEAARQIAELLLKENGISARQIDRLLATEHISVLPLFRPVTVWITYWTALPSDTGKVVVYPDVYNLMSRPAGSVIMAHATVPTQQLSGSSATVPPATSSISTESGLAASERDDNKT
jgi:murein L,D-transpeptidase YcbB/YkuD